MGVSPFGHPRIVAYLQLPAAFRSLSRPSSAPDAKAFTLCSSSLELPSVRLSPYLLFLALLSNCLSFFVFSVYFALKKLCFFSLSTSRGSSAFRLPYHASVKLFYPTFYRKTYITLRYICPLSVRFFSFLLFIRFSMNMSRELCLFSCFARSLTPGFSRWLAQVDSNHRPRAYQARALTS